MGIACARNVRVISRSYLNTSFHTRHTTNKIPSMALRGVLGSLLVLDHGVAFEVLPAKNVGLVMGMDVVARTGEEYICATTDWWPPTKCDYGTCAWSDAPSGSNPSIPFLDLNKPLFKAAFDALSPFIWRLGGSLQDDITYEEPGNPAVTCPPITNDPDAQWGFTGGCLTRARWTEIASFARDHNAKLVFGLNGLHGRRHVKDREWTGSWDPTNAKSLMSYTKESGLPIHAWELGNELGGWNGIQAQLGAQEVGRDFVALRRIVTELWGSGEGSPLIVGPDTGLDIPWFTEFLKAANGSLDAVAIHMYALGAGVDPTLAEKIMDPAHMATASKTAQDLATLITDLAATSGKDVPQLWMGEDGGAYNSGRNGTTNRFTAGFWSLNELGIFARAGFSVYCRQTLLGGNYGLLDKDTLQPNPDFFNYLLFKRLMGPEVLDVQSSRREVTAYAHCTRRGIAGFPIFEAGAVTVLILNFMSDFDAEIGTMTVTRDAQKDLLTGPRLEYTLTAGTPGELNSTFSNLNGQPLRVSETGIFPAMLPLIIQREQTLTVPKQSYGFYVFPEARVQACM